MTFQHWLQLHYAPSSAYQYGVALRSLLTLAGLPDAPEGPFDGFHGEAVAMRVRQALATSTPATQRNAVGAWNRWTDYLRDVHRITLPDLTVRRKRTRLGGTSTDADAPPGVPATVLSAILALLRPPVRIGTPPFPAERLAGAWWGDVDTGGRSLMHAASVRLWYRERGLPAYTDTDAVLPWIVLAAWASGGAQPFTQPAPHAPLIPTTRGGLVPLDPSRLAAIQPSLGIVPLPEQSAARLVFIGDDLRVDADPWRAPPVAHAAPVQGPPVSADLLQLAAALQARATLHSAYGASAPRESLRTPVDYEPEQEPPAVSRPPE